MKKQGRPSKLTNELLEHAEKYLESDYKKQEVVPTIAGMAVYLGTTRQRLHAWVREEKEESKEYEKNQGAETLKTRFRYIMESLMAKQEVVLLNGGLRNELNTTIAKVMLTKHDYSDRVDNTLSNPSGESFSITWEK